MKEKILFIVGSPNQTTQMHQISAFFDKDYDCYFTQFYTLNYIGLFLKKIGFFDRTVLAGTIMHKAEAYLETHNLKIDYAGKKHGSAYKMVFFCTDMIVPKNLPNAKKVWIQEGMIDRLNGWGRAVKLLKLPAFFAANTALNGSTNKCDLYFTASEGYSKHFAKMGTDLSKLIATGIPNFDNAERFLVNDFMLEDYVLVCTSDIRELGGFENRVKFIKESVKKGNGKQLIFKLHPNEKFKRAQKEILAHSPKGTLVFQEGNTNEMIANCSELITQWSSVAYIGIALGKKVHSYFDVETLKNMAMIQNNGESARNIAEISKTLIENPKQIIITEKKKYFEFV